MPESLNPVTPRGAAIAELFSISLWASFVVVLLVCGLLAYVVLRFRAPAGAALDDPHQTHGNTRLEIAWTIVPVLVLVAFFFLMLRTMHAVEADAPADALEVRVVAHQWWWEYHYPTLGIVTANELHFPTDRPIRLVITSADVIHSFWIPRLGWKRDAVPGQLNQITAEFVLPGLYDGWCTEYCGLQHTWMRVLAFVEPPEQFDAWVRQQQQTAATATLSPAAQRGAQLFMTNTCVNCHAIGGTAATARVGPDLTHFGSRTTIGAGIVDNTPDNLMRWLREVQSIKPGVLMPNYTALSDEEIAALAAYLQELK